MCLKGVYYGKHIISNEQINATLHVMCSKILVRECLKNVVNTLVLLCIGNTYLLRIFEQECGKYISDTSLMYFPHS